MTAERSWSPVRCQSCGREEAEIELTFYAEHRAFLLCVRCSEDAVANVWPAVERLERLA